MPTTRLVRSCLAAIAATVAAAPLPAAPPSHRIFLTSTAYTGSLGGLAGADALCQAHAASGTLTQPLGYTWRALLSVNGVVNAKDRFVWSGPVADVTGLVVTNDPGTWPWADDGDSTLDVDENGGPPPDAFVWTGSDVTGVSVGSGYDCNGWTNGTGDFDGWSGETGYFPADNWIDSFGSGCGDDWYSLYCVSDASIFSDGFETDFTCNWSSQVGNTQACA